MNQFKEGFCQLGNREEYLLSESFCGRESTKEWLIQKVEIISKLYLLLFSTATRTQYPSILCIIEI